MTRSQRFLWGPKSRVGGPRNVKASGTIYMYKARTDISPVKMYFDLEEIAKEFIFAGIGTLWGLVSQKKSIGKYKWGNIFFIGIENKHFLPIFDTKFLRVWNCGSLYLHF